MSDATPARYLVCDGARVIELEAVPAGGYRFDPPPDGEAGDLALDGRCDRPEDAFWHFREEPPPAPSPLLEELMGLHAAVAAGAEPDLRPGERVLIARRGDDTLGLFRAPNFGGGYAVRDPDDGRVHTTAFSLSECFEMAEDVRALNAEDDAAFDAPGRAVSSPRPVGAAA